MSRNPIPESQPRFCPQCGQRVASVVRKPLPPPPPPPPMETTTRGPRVPEPPPAPPNRHLQIGAPDVLTVIVCVLVIVITIVFVIGRVKGVWYEF